MRPSIYPTISRINSAIDNAMRQVNALTVRFVPLLSLTRYTKAEPRLNRMTIRKIMTIDLNSTPLHHKFGTHIVT